jgi:hypothetical protein
MHKKQKNTETGLVDESTQVDCADPRSSIGWAIVVGVAFGAFIGAVVGFSLRPKEELTEMSHEWLDEFREITDRVSGRVRKQVREIVSKNMEPAKGYEEYPESYG